MSYEPEDMSRGDVSTCKGKGSDRQEQRLIKRT